MSIHAVVLVHIIVSAMYGAHGQLTIHPEQVHLSYGGMCLLCSLFEAKTFCAPFDFFDHDNCGVIAAIP